MKVRPRVVERLLRDQRPLEELARAIEGLRGLNEVGVGLLHVGRLLDVGQAAGIRRAVLRQRARERSLLLLVGVLLFLAIELDDSLPGLHSIAKVGQDPTHFAVGLR